MVKYTDEQILELLQHDFSGKRILLLSPMVKGRKGHYKELFENVRKKGFILDLNFGLNSFLVDYELQINQDILQQFIITDQIFEDGLTKDAFIKTLKRVFKSKLHCIWLIDKTFGRLPPRPSNENDMFI